MANRRTTLFLGSLLLFILVFGNTGSLYQENKDLKNEDILFSQLNVDSTDQIEKTRILVDLSHGWEVFIPAKISPMGAILEATGNFEVISLFMEVINDSVLADIDILMLATPDPNLPYDSAEIEAISKFWREGGSILFVGSYQGSGYDTYRPNSEVNRIISHLGFNITFSEDRLVHARGENSHSLPSHPLTYGIKNTYFYDGCPIVIGNEPEIDVISDRKDKPNYVAWSNLTHRAVFLGGIDPLFEFDSKTVNNDPNAYNYSHHYQFQLNIFHWLSYRSPEIIQDYRPIRMYTGNQNQISSASLRQLPFFKGGLHFHTETSKIAATNEQIAARSVELGYQFIVVTDYNDISGGPKFNQTIMSGQYKVKDRLIQIINGVEVTGLGQYHTTGWGLTEDIEGVLDPFERIALFHAQGSPIILDHPSWLICPAPYQRIWDHNVYPFDGYNIISSGFIQGNGNLVYTGKPWCGGPDDSGVTWNKTWMYIFTEDISSDTAWLESAFELKRSVIYNAKDDVYFGDDNLVDELLGRFEDESKPVLFVSSNNTFSPSEDVIIDIIVDDASPTVVTLTENGMSKGEMNADTETLGRFTMNLGNFTSGTELQISVKAEDDKGFQSTHSFTVNINEEIGTTTSSSSPGLLWFSLPILIPLIERKRRSKMS